MDSNRKKYCKNDKVPNNELLWTVIRLFTVASEKKSATAQSVSGMILGKTTFQKYSFGHFEKFENLKIFEAIGHASNLVRGGSIRLGNLKFYSFSKWPFAYLRNAICQTIKIEIEWPLPFFSRKAPEIFCII